MTVAIWITLALAGVSAIAALLKMAWNTSAMVQGQEHTLDAIDERTKKLESERDALLLTRNDLQYLRGEVGALARTVSEIRPAVTALSHDVADLRAWRSKASDRAAAVVTGQHQAIAIPPSPAMPRESQPRPYPLGGRRDPRREDK